MKAKDTQILRVRRTKAQAKASYDKMSRFYDYFAGVFEKKYRELALAQLNVQPGETVLEIGFGTGHSLLHMAESVGENGRVYGIDISPGMLAVSQRRVAAAGFAGRVELTCGDALQLPYAANMFDATFMSFTLELFDTPEIPALLAEIRRVLKADGRLGVVSMSREDGNSYLLRLYEWAHEKLPRYIDCRPIYVAGTLKSAGFAIAYQKRVSLLGLPGEIVVTA